MLWKSPAILIKQIPNSHTAWGLVIWGPEGKGQGSYRTHTFLDTALPHTAFIVTSPRQYLHPPLQRSLASPSSPQRWGIKGEWRSLFFPYHIKLHFPGTSSEKDIQDHEGWIASSLPTWSFSPSSYTSPLLRGCCLGIKWFLDISTYRDLCFLGEPVGPPNCVVCFT